MSEVDVFLCFCFVFVFGKGGGQIWNTYIYMIVHAIKHLYIVLILLKETIRSNARKITLRLSLEYRIDKESYRY